MTKNRTQNGNLFSARFCSSGKAAGPRRAQSYCCTSSIGDGPRTQPGSKIAAKNRRRIETRRGLGTRQVTQELVKIASQRQKRREL